MAADRLTQLQDAVNLQAENFCNIIGALQATAKESPFPEFRISNKNDSNNESSDVDCVTDNNNPTATVDLLSSLLATSGNVVPSSSPSASSTVTSITTASTTATAATPTISSPSSKLSSPSTLVSSQPVDANNDDKISIKVATNNSNNANNNNNNNTTNQNEATTASTDSNNTPASNPPPIIQEDYSQMFARLVARTAKDIDTLVESLPSTFETETAGSSDLHSESIKQLEEENAECIVKLERAIEHGESILAMIREALDDIAMTQFRSQNLAESEQN